MRTFPSGQIRWGTLYLTLGACLGLSALYPNPAFGLDLLRDHFGSVEKSIPCCLSGASNRCLERLVREEAPDAMTGACASMIGLAQQAAALLTPLDPAQRPCPDKGVLGITTSNYRKNGWWQDGPPDWMYGPSLYPAQAVAASSPGCINLQESEPSRKAAANCAKKGYETVHLYISLSPDFMTDYAESISRNDPWFKHRDTQDRVFLIKTQNVLEIREAVLRLLAQCKIADFVNVSGHGAPGMVLMGSPSAPGQKKIEGVTTNTFFRYGVSPCVLAPGAKIQFNGCSQACSPATEAVRKGLEVTLNDPVYRQAGNQSPFEGVSLLFATTTTWTETNSHSDSAFSRSKNDLGIVYKVSGDHVQTDIPATSSPACSHNDIKGLPANLLDEVARGI